MEGADAKVNEADCLFVGIDNGKEDVIRFIQSTNKNEVTIGQVTFIFNREGTKVLQAKYGSGGVVLYKDYANFGDVTYPSGFYIPINDDTFAEFIIDNVSISRNKR